MYDKSLKISSSLLFGVGKKLYTVFESVYDLYYYETARCRHDVQINTSSKTVNGTDQKKKRTKLNALHSNGFLRKLKKKTRFLHWVSPRLKL